MLSIKSENPNYLARIVKMPELRPHPNADRLALVNLQGQTIITGKDAKVGELYVLFQLESKINYLFLSYSNNFTDLNLNKDKTKKGFFGSNQRVRAQKLRSILSEGYLHPVSDFNDWLKSVGINYQITENDLNKDFDHIGDVLIVEKYVAKSAKQSNSNKKSSKLVEENKIIDGQFKLSPDYKNFKREIYSINPEDWIDISSKWHGANGVISRILVKRDLTWYEKLLKNIGIKIDDKKYDLVFSSRKVISYKPVKSNNPNIWEIVANKYRDSIKDGISLIGEVVGYTPTGKGVQSMGGKVYDYGCEPGKCDFIVFRITYTSVSGDIYEFSTQQVIDYCSKMGLKCIPFYYIGKAKDKYPNLEINDNWHENFLNELIKEYLEKDDIYCKSKGLADEGVVVARRIGKFEGLKLKSQRFILGETTELDKEQVNIEDASDEEVALKS